jgi:hypothetical protein
MNMGLSKTPGLIRLGRTIGIEPALRGPECMNHVDKTLKDRLDIGVVVVGFGAIPSAATIHEAMRPKVFLDISFLGIGVLAKTVGGDFGRRGCGRVMCIFKVARVVIGTYLREG